MPRLRFQLWHTLCLTALTGLVCAVGVEHHKHCNLLEQLERTSSIHAEDWDVKKLTQILKQKYGIQVAVEKRFIRRKLIAWDDPGLSLKTSLRIILGSADLSYTTNYTELTIVEFEEASWEETETMPVFGID